LTGTALHTHKLLLFKLINRYQLLQFDIHLLRCCDRLFLWVMWTELYLACFDCDSQCNTCCVLYALLSCCIFLCICCIFTSRLTRDICTVLLCCCMSNVYLWNVIYYVLQPLKWIFETSYKRVICSYTFINFGKQQTENQIVRTSAYDLDL